jgi:hypothetical protein
VGRVRKGNFVRSRVPGASPLFLHVWDAADAVMELLQVRSPQLRILAFLERGARYAALVPRGIGWTCDQLVEFSLFGHIDATPVLTRLSRGPHRV